MTWAEFLFLSLNNIFCNLYLNGIIIQITGEQALERDVRYQQKKKPNMYVNLCL